MPGRTSDDEHTVVTLMGLSTQDHAAASAAVRAVDAQDMPDFDGDRDGAVDPVALLGVYAEIKNQHDVDGMLGRTHPDCVYEDVGVDRVVTGIPELRQYHEHLFAALPDYTATVEGIAGAGDTAVAWGRFAGVFGRPLFGRGRSGDRVDVAAVFVCEFHEGLLHRERAHVDLASLRRQLASPADRFVDAFTATWAQPSAADLAVLFTEDAVVTRPGMSAPARGSAQISRHFEQVIASMPDLRLEPLATSVSGRTVFVHWCAHATIAGSAASWDGMDRFDLHGERAMAGIAFFDPAAARQTTAAS